MVLETEPIVFRSKVDGWIAAIVIVGIAVSVWATIAAHRADLGGSWLPMLVFFVILGGVLAVSVPIRYVITDRELIVRAGMTRSRIPLDRIQSVRPSADILAAPALSLDRLRIDHQGGVFGYALVSPEDPDVFLTLLEERAGLTRSEDGLVREVT